MRPGMAKRLLTFQSVSFGSSAAIGIGMGYTIDCYKPIAGEVVVSQVVFKCKLLIPSKGYRSLKSDKRTF